MSRSLHLLILANPCIAQYVGGVGNDPRASRQFNPIKQANDVSLALHSAPPAPTDAVALSHSTTRKAST